MFWRVWAGYLDNHIWISGKYFDSSMLQRCEAFGLSEKTMPSQNVEWKSQDQGSGNGNGEEEFESRV